MRIVVSKMKRPKDTKIQKIGVKAITDDAEEACGSCTSCDTLRIGNRENTELGDWILQWDYLGEEAS